jgi:hypothetical protein
MASDAEEKRLAALREYYRRNPHKRPEDPLAETSRTQVAKTITGASVKEQKYQQMLAARKARMQQKKKPTARANKGGMPDLTGDGKVTQADVLKGRGVFMKGGMKKKRNANIDYRKSGMFYVGGMSAKPTKINKGKK